jgi:vacuolar-type H+-ATPase subunit H
LAQQQTTASEEAERLRLQIAGLENRVARLAKWEHVADADAMATQLVDQARSDAAKLVGETQAAKQAAEDAASSLRQAAQTEADAIRRDAKAKAVQTTADAEARLADAESRARAVVEEANRKAEETAGDALRALREAQELERTVVAMENQIKGYGDAYLVPPQSLLDDLAEDFGHTDAGQKLKLVRDRVRQAVRSGDAASCGYVESTRREIAIRFVIDAFNGKVDSILTKVRTDNFGTLQQALRDACALVNHNARAFRNAHVNESYLKLREEELSWAVIVIELKEKEREEQRRIKEQLREEEKARKEYDRAIKEAARDEELVRKAMAKAEEQLARATAEQRVKYEEQLIELQGRLQAAEERNQRALSMAQQTRRGHVYVISNQGSFGEDVYKIGLTRRLEPLDRIRELGDSSVPFEFDVHALIFAEDAPALETKLHHHFALKQINKVNYRKEFFRVSIAEIRNELEALGLAATWTMAAAAREYRETLAIEHVIAKDPLAREAWLKRQLLLDPGSEEIVTEVEPA